MSLGLWYFWAWSLPCEVPGFGVLSAVRGPRGAPVLSASFPRADVPPVFSRVTTDGRASAFGFGVAPSILVRVWGHAHTRFCWISPRCVSACVRLSQTLPDTFPKRLCQRSRPPAKRASSNYSASLLRTGRFRVFRVGPSVGLWYDVWLLICFSMLVSETGTSYTFTDLWTLLLCDVRVCLTISCGVVCLFLFDL